MVFILFMPQNTYLSKDDGYIRVQCVFLEWDAVNWSGKGLGKYGEHELRGEPQMHWCPDLERVD